MLCPVVHGGLGYAVSGTGSSWKAIVLWSEVIHMLEEGQRGDAGYLIQALTRNELYASGLNVFSDHHMDTAIQYFLKAAYGV